MITVLDVLKRKGKEIFSTAPDTFVFDALKVMSDENVGTLLVLRKGKLVGIFSERDYARKVILKGKSSRETVVQEIMTEEVYTVRPDQNIRECMELMTNRQIRHLPVMEGEKLVGIISIGDVVKYIIEDQKDTIDKLETYITGR
jgi:CBS domain-containing protein